MKKIVIGLLICVAVIAVASYLYLSGGSSANDSLVPNNATGVAIFDPVKAVKETDLKFSMEDLSHKNGVKTGINFVRPIYAFITETGYLGIAAVLTDSDDLESNLQNVRSHNGLTWGLKEGFMVCHDGERVLAFGPSLSWNDKNAQREMEELMCQETSGSLLLQELHQIDAPVAAKISMKAVPVGVKKGMEEKMSEYSLSHSSIDIESIILTLKANATENKVVLNASLSSSNKETSAVMEEFQKKLKPVSHHLDVHIPQDYSMWMTASVDGAAICDAMKKNPYTSNQMDMLSGFVNVSEILNVFCGDILLVAGDAKKKEVAMVAEVNNTSIVNSSLRKILGWFDIKMGVFEKESANPIYITNSDRMKKEMENGGYVIDENDGYNDSCIFFMTMHPSKVMSASETYALNTDEFKAAVDFLRDNVRKINLRATQKELECKMVLSTTFNDYISK